MITYGQRLVAGFPVLAAGSAAYTMPGTKTKVVVTHARAMNYSADPETITLYLVPNGQSVADRYKVCAKAIAAGESLVISDIIGDALVATGDFIHAVAASNAKVNLTLIGTEWT